eukprot:CAMPEP_0182932810 /NCGR_PEP_ID=MMETSP0105_2-20130417/32337_1 /TAXON_ID=81532 ORGANISM="Acanthoeca-like sp., Strain 10tr" /NCGR_SAMPLE_ID=MMETSP0105_2 /ASSEMBLY_ACC=CAM_ASM_000205 /LENGTH=57 /DNA_ID=CAMNT_0025071463 /DNA_START=549 /DNA_END=719 /DNA_ORIENTATION=+
MRTARPRTDTGECGALGHAHVSSRPAPTWDATVSGGLAHSGDSGASRAPARTAVTSG